MDMKTTWSIPSTILQDQKREESDPDLGIQQQVYASHRAFLSPDKAFVLRVV
jgi:hypothetical protein